jgi:energy-coupling factor transport system substrate-specific component
MTQNNPERTFHFTLYDILTIAILCAIGLAIKPVINPMIHTFTSIIRIPGGAVAGGFTMMWMALTRVKVNKPGSALLFGISQGLVVMLLGFFGSHGAFSIVTYVAPAVFIEIFALLFRGHTLFHFSLYTIVANITGSLLVALWVMRLPMLMIWITVVLATISGMLGGLMAQMIYQKVFNVEKTTPSASHPPLRY